MEIERVLLLQRINRDYISLFAVSSHRSLCWQPSLLISTRPPEALWCSSPGCSFLEKMLSGSWTLRICWSFPLMITQARTVAMLQIKSQIIIPPQTRGLLITWAVIYQVTVEGIHLLHLTSLHLHHQNQELKMHPYPKAPATPTPRRKANPSLLLFCLLHKDLCPRFWSTTPPSSRSGLHQACLTAACVLRATSAQTA